MLSSIWGPYKSPDVLAKELTFTKNGLLIWQSVSKHLGFKFKWRGYAMPPHLIKTPFLLEVDKSHWVLAMQSGNSLKGIYKIADPWFGDIASSSRYKKITGYATFEKGEKEEPPEPTWIGKLIKRIPFPFWIGTKKKK
jgi:hypothetical protein